ncbi:aldolase [Suillus fuscotomentosus]|uniref:hydroxymethylglutaryl-CoA lyase n=1 Tax=Suillus fuscotomentosus TaxID=1912939 RepID=A0AAD4ECD4_9AGAM|nr:aldolase [Suillus fuscotomentosus]KAG1903562.1 aldolase [Suillus fuscotomentosus]
MFYLSVNSSCIRVLRSTLKTTLKSFSTSQPTLSTASSTNPNFVKIVEVGPRDGLQNEPKPIPPPIKAELINRLAIAGMRNIEAGSFVSPKWMAGTAEVLALIDSFPKTGYSVLVPNQKGLHDLLEILSTSTSPNSHAKPPPPVTEVAIFTSATDGFSLANTNVSVSGSLERLAPVARRALDAGLKVRGYVSVVVTCPFSGRVDPRRVRDVSRELVQMGCYEVSLGDTTGAGTPASILGMLEEVAKEVDIGILAGHFHDTNGTATANIMTALDFGLRTFDASVGGLGGCPYSPGATGNVATEDVVYALTGDRLFGDIGEPYGKPAKAVQSRWDVGPVDLVRLAEIGAWISGVLGRETTSRAGKALLARRKREEDRKRKEGAKL